MGEIVYTGDYVKLVNEIIEYAHNAFPNDEYFQIFLLKRVVCLYSYRRLVPVRVKEG